MFPLGSTPSKRPKRRVESYRILYAHILHALSLPGHPLRVTEKATHGEQVGLYSLHSRMGTSITVNIVPKCEVCPRDHGKVVESLRGDISLSIAGLQQLFPFLKEQSDVISRRDGFMERFFIACLKDCSLKSRWRLILNLMRQTALCMTLRNSIGIFRTTIFCPENICKVKRLLLNATFFVCFVALRPKSTSMVIAGRSVHLTTLFPGQA